jgi:hypothetical protein
MPTNKDRTPINKYSDFIEKESQHVHHSANGRICSVKGKVATALSYFCKQEGCSGPLPTKEKFLRSVTATTLGPSTR